MTRRSLKVTRQTIDPAVRKNRDKRETKGYSMITFTLSLKLFSLSGIFFIYMTTTYNFGLQILQKIIK